MLVPLGDGLYEVPSPALLAAAEEVVARGVALGHALDLIGASSATPARSSKEFVKLFIDDVWKPFVDAGMPDARWGDRPTRWSTSARSPPQALLAVFRRTMDDEVEPTFAELARRLANSKR